MIRNIFGRDGDFERFLGSRDGNNVLRPEEDIVLAEEIFRVSWPCMVCIKDLDYCTILPPCRPDGIMGVA